MDPKDKEISDLKAQVETLTKERDTAKTEAATVTTERDSLKADNTKLGQDIKDKDGVIDQKNRDIVGLRKEGKKLKDMTEAEKAELTKTELELKQKSEELADRQAKFEGDQLAEQKKQVEARQTAIFSKMVGGKPELLAKLKENWGKLDATLTSKATTEEEISKLAGDAYNMLGTLKPNPVVDAIVKGGNGGTPDGTQPNFAETPDGQALASNLGINVGQNAKK